MSTQERRALPADVFDTLEFTSLVFGGIGRGADRVFRGLDAIPCCIHGQAYEAEPEAKSFHGTVTAALYRVGIDRTTNDEAVAKINARRRKPRDTRVPFSLYTKELGIVRGS